MDLETSTVSNSGIKFKSKRSTQYMVDCALRKLNDRDGSSLGAVKGFIASNYNIDVQSSSTNQRIKKYMKDSVANGKFIKASGRGAVGLFKMKTQLERGLQPKIKIKLAGLTKKPRDNRFVKKETSLIATEPQEKQSDSLEEVE